MSAVKRDRSSDSQTGMFRKIVETYVHYDSISRLQPLRATHATCIDGRILAVTLTPSRGPLCQP